VAVGLAVRLVVTALVKQAAPAPVPEFPQAASTPLRPRAGPASGHWPSPQESIGVIDPG
jgi:hypothetical protein